MNAPNTTCGISGAYIEYGKLYDDPNKKTRKQLKADDYDEVFLITRGNVSVWPYSEKGNVTLVREVSPSWPLLNRAKGLERSGKWNYDTFMSEYAQDFVKEMHAPESKAKLHEIAKIALTKKVLVVCFCKNEQLCHRSIVIQIVNAINEAKK